MARKTLQRLRLQPFYLSLPHSAKAALARYRPEAGAHSAYAYLWNLAAWALGEPEPLLAERVLVAALELSEDLEDDLRLRIGLIGVYMDQRRDWPGALVAAVGHCRAVRAGAPWLADRELADELSQWAARRLWFAGFMLRRSRRWRTPARGRRPTADSGARS